VLGSGAVQHWNGSSWSPAGPTGSVFAVAAVAPNDVWAVGVDSAFTGLIAHWDGASWTSALDSAAQYFNVAASGPKDVWVTTSGGGARHFDGVTWSDISFTFDGGTAPITALGPGEAIAVEFDGFVYRFTGQALGTYGLPTFGAPIQTMWSSSGTDIYVGEGNAIYENTPTGFIKVLTAAGGATFSGLAGSSASNIWAVASNGALYHFDTAWGPVTPPVSALQPPLWVGASDVWTFSAGAAHHGPPPWTDYSVPSVQQWLTVSGDSTNDLWAITQDVTALSNNLMHWNGSTWGRVITPRTDLTAVGVRASDDVWVATSSQHMMHWDGTAWTQTPITALHPLRWFVPMAADDVFAASDWDLFHYDGSRWSRVRPDVDTTLQNNAISAVTSPSPAHFQYVHQQGTVRDLIRVKPWVCRAHETNCNDSIDDDCDGKIDHDDSDCP
jgi:hypothetical protein